MATHNIAEDQTRITIQIPKAWRATLDNIAENEGYSSVGEVIRSALEDRYFGKTKLESKSLMELRKALEKGFHAAVEYLEKEDKPLYQRVAEAQGKYGSNVNLKIEKPPVRKPARKKQA